MTTVIKKTFFIICAPQKKFTLNLKIMTNANKKKQDLCLKNDKLTSVLTIHIYFFIL